MEGLLTLFAETEIFVFVYMEIVTKLQFTHLLVKTRWPGQ